MRFSILLPLTLLATYTAGLVIPQDIAARDIDSLEVREGLIDDSLDYSIFRREPKKGKAAKAAAAANKVAKKAHFAPAAAAHKKTIGLPNRKTIFHVPGSAATGKKSQTYTGKQVRKAVFDGHVIAGKSPSQQKKHGVVAFQNRNHANPHASGKGGVKPLKNMHPTRPAREVRLPNQHPGHLAHGAKPPPGPARVITQVNKKGNHVFRGVIAHDQSRAHGSHGANDHFKVKGNKSHRRS
ncbi:hypothetical protein CPB83DRAFT_892604 [Crepidotus variabilis]|uniref:Uncharacterized protein n=1 Tax=Crepidotus variabilis TaxID=179855 RepID=A0A9P6EKR5_9AGAR|nr:hypothetical protein CPB83DRAFT_892604 [Crepidotus variabilis]